MMLRLWLTHLTGRALKTDEERQKIINKIKADGRDDKIQSILTILKIIKVAKDMAYLEGQNLADYLYDMK